ncbi:unnamed protein product [Trifolium pratense]|uniref:Uncharacterized protein n=1 Tax=Trifolium pratense TaxID=57577 RepID=A0ACB0K6K1_TRIPR|nr:unnamed protein product [Trifolium pratense]
MTSLAGSGEPPLPPPGGGGDLGGQGSDPATRGQGKRLAHRDLKRRTVYNRNLTSMPRRLNPDGTEVPLVLDPEEETRVDDEINPADLLAPREFLLVDRFSRPVIMPYLDDFQPQKAASTSISAAIEKNFHQPWLSWKEIKKDKIAWESFWNTFRSYSFAQSHKNSTQFQRSINMAEQTFIMIKPDGVQRGLVGEIISRFEKKGFYLKGLKFLNVERAFAEKHYADLSAKPFFGGLVEYIVSGPVVAMKKTDWIGENAWPGLQEKWGTADYKKKCEQAVANKASNSRGGSIHRGGQTSGASFSAQFFQDNERDPTMLDVHEYFHKKPDGTWDTVEAARVQREMEQFEENFNAQQNALPPSEQATEELRDTIMLDQFVEVAGGMKKKRLRGQGNASSLVIRTPMGYRLDPSSTLSNVCSSSYTARSHAAVNFEEMERRLKADNDARVQAEVASQLKSHLDTMRSQLRAETMENMDLIIQRTLSQRDIRGQQYQRQSQQQNSQNMPTRHSTYTSSNPHQQHQRYVPQMPSRHSSVQETSRFQPMSFQSNSSSLQESGGSSRFVGQTSNQSLTYQELAYRPTVDFNQSTSQIPPFNAANLTNNMINEEFISDFLPPFDNQGVN